MPGEFDPYHKWLGIPPRDQPANHYRLLGLELFESDREVIQRAAARQTSYVQNVRSGEHVRAAEMLLEQLSEARSCLLDPEKKNLYDEGLRDGQKSEWKRKRSVAGRGATTEAGGASKVSPGQESAPPSKHKPQSVARPVVRSMEVGSKPNPAASASTHRRTLGRKRRKPLAILIAVIASLLVAALAILLRPSPVENELRDDQPAGSPPDAQLAASDQPASNREAVREVVVSPAAADQATAQPLESPLSDPEQPGANSPDEQAAPTESPAVTLPETTRFAANAPTERDDAAASDNNTVEPFPYDGMILWLDAADGERIEVGEDRHVKVWYDGSGAGHHASPAAETEAPLLVPLSGGLAVVRFSGAQSLANEDAAAFNVQDDYSILAVARGDTGVLLDKGDGYNEAAFSFWNGVTSVRTHQRTLKSGAAASPALQVHSLVADEWQVRWHIDGTLQREFDGPHSIDNEEALLIGRRCKEDDPRYFVGDLAELLIWDRALSDGELQAVEEYLLAKWSPAAGELELAAAGDTKAVPDDADSGSHATAERNEWLPAPRGAILREVWLDVPGSSVEDFLAYVSERPEPSEREEIDRLEPPEDYADNYGQRLRGYLHPPATGEYLFSVKANAEALLYISPDARPENKRLIDPAKLVRLQGDTAHFIEAYHKESTGRDYLIVGWTLPDGVEENPIPSDRLSVHDRIAPRHQTEFVPLTLVSSEASAGSTLAADEEGRIAVTAAANQPETFSLVFQPSMRRLTALRLEALPHADLPSGGPGLGAGGRFVIDEVELYVVSDADASDKQPVAFARITSDAGADLMRLADGDATTQWRASGRGTAAAATFFPAEPIAVAGSKLLLTIQNRELLGSFRVSATSAPDPSNLKQPTDSATEAFVLHVNLGGETHTAPDGVVWKESKLFDNQTFGHEGGRSVHEDDVANPVQGSALRGIQAFRAMVPEGTYEVTLYFCEYWTTQPSARTFSIAAEQRNVARNINLLQAAGGFGRPLAVPIRNVAVKDGRLDIEFQPSQPQASAILNAIRIQQVK